MKFCNRCGTRCSEDALFCTNCGYDFKSASAETNQTYSGGNASNGASQYVNPYSVTTRPKVNNGGIISNFFFDIFFMLYAVFSFLSVAFAYIYSSSYSDAIYFWLDEGAVVLSGICAFAMFILGIVCLALGSRNKDDLKSKLAGVFRFIAGIVFLIVALIVMGETL
jgi:hypothetical protein